MGNEFGADPHTLNDEFMLKNALSVERIVENCNGMLNHLIEVVRYHREQDDGGICPSYCWGEHFRVDMMSLINEQPGDTGINMTMEMFHLALMRLAGYDSR